jgi:tetratricopeptide (TPR) repeat protein
LHTRHDRFDDAEKAYHESLRIKIKFLGDDSLDVAEILNNIALLYQKQHRLDDAASSLKEALRIRSKKRWATNIWTWQTR